jgi:hypothetical protein
MSWGPLADFFLGLFILFAVGDPAEPDRLREGRALSGVERREKGIFG